MTSRCLLALVPCVLACGKVQQQQLPVDAPTSDDGSIDAPSDATVCTRVVLEYMPIAAQNVVSGPGRPVAQTIVPTTTMEVEQVVLPLFSCKANGLVDARVVLHPTIGSNRAPDSTMTLAASELVPNAMIADSCVAGDVFQPAAFTFANTVVLERGVSYAIVLQAIGAGAGALNWRRSSTPTDPSNPYPDGTNWQEAGGSWSEGNTALDLAFHVRGQACE
jgi:hypothetical protein